MTAIYHYSRQGRNTMSYDDGKYAFGVDDRWFEKEVSA